MYEYFTLYTYINQNNWVILYQGHEFSKNEYLQIILNELGKKSWELISQSTFTDGKVINRAFVPISAETDVAYSYTSSEVYYFKRELKEISSYSYEYEEKLKIFNKQIEQSTNKINKTNEIKNLFLKSFVDKLNEMNFEEKTPTSNKILYSFYSLEENTITSKNMFGKETTGNIKKK